MLSLQELAKAQLLQIKLWPTLNLMKQNRNFNAWGKCDLGMIQQDDTVIGNFKSLLSPKSCTVLS